VGTKQRKKEISYPHYSISPHFRNSFRRSSQGQRLLLGWVFKGCELIFRHPSPVAISKNRGPDPKTSPCLRRQDKFEIHFCRYGERHRTQGSCRLGRPRWHRSAQHGAVADGTDNKTTRSHHNCRSGTMSGSGVIEQNLSFFAVVNSSILTLNIRKDVQLCLLKGKQRK
jgi:hypothetical protein